MVHPAERIKTVCHKSRQGGSGFVSKLAQSRTVLIMVPFFAFSISLGGPVPDLDSEQDNDHEQEKWEYSISAYTYVVRNGADFVNPNVIADYDWFHLEVRYNYEALKTGAIWLGYNFTAGDKLVLDVTPMLGGVFGNLTGIAPGYSISAKYARFDFSTEGEYFFDPGNSANNFFYSWSELAVAPTKWLRIGLVAERTNNFGNSSALQPGPFIGIRHDNVEFATYWIGPGSKNGAVVLAMTLNF